VSGVLKCGLILLSEQWIDFHSLHFTRLLANTPSSSIQSSVLITEYTFGSYQLLKTSTELNEQDQLGSSF